MYSNTMAIRNPLTQDLNTINERIRNRQDVGNLVNDQLFWLLNNQTNNRIIVDNNFLAQIGNINTNINYATQIGNLNGQITAINTQIGSDTTIPPTGLMGQLVTQRARNATTEASGLGVPGNQLWATINNISQDIQRRIADINTQITRLEGQRTPLENQRTEYQNIQNMYGNLLTLRTNEITNITNAANTFNQNGTLNPQILGYSQGLAQAIDLNTSFRTNNGATSYEFCDTNTGDPLLRQNNNIQVTVAWGQTVTIRWVTIVGNTLNIQNIQIDPITGINFPLNIQTAIRGRIQEQTTGINLDHFKTLNITINAPQLPLPNRQNAYNNLNQWGTIDNRLAAEYSEPHRVTVENEIIWEILRANGNQTEIDQIYNDQQKRDILIERIRNIPNLIPVFALGQLQAWFMNEMTRLNRNIPVQFLVSENAFTDYLRNNLQENTRNYVRGEIRTAINTTIQRNNILRTVMNFQSDVINDKLDNNDHRTLDQNIPNNRPQGHPNTRLQRLTRRRSNRNNWTKFFDGRESEAHEDKLETNEGELGFNLKVAVHWVNKIVTTINIQGEDEPIILDTRDVNEMSHMILRLEATKTGEPINRKLRCRMALNAVKAVVSMSPVTLHRQYQGNIRAVDGQQYAVDRISTHIRWGNLVVRWSCANSHNNPPTQYRQRINHVIFDEQRYKGLHNINELERGMIALSGQINDIMDAMGNEFRQATSRITTPLMKYNTTQYLRWGHIKRLRARMAYGKTNRKFDFDTSASSWSKTVNIKFEKGKFTLSGTFKDKPFEFAGSNLGVILRKKIDRLRVFDGVELAIFEKINESMITQLRTNNLIGPENFCATDLNANKTGRIFMMDSHGDLSYIEIEDRNLNPLRNGRTYGRINFNNLPPQRIRCNEQERREFMQNPLLSGRLIRAMRQRLQLI